MRLLRRSSSVLTVITAVSLLLLGLGVTAQHTFASGATVTTTPDTGLSQTSPVQVQVDITGALPNTQVYVLQIEQNNGPSHGAGGTLLMTDGSGDASTLLTVNYSNPASGWTTCTNDPPNGDRCIVEAEYSSNQVIIGQDPLTFGPAGPPYTDPGQIAENTAWPNATVPAPKGNQGANGGSNLEVAQSLDEAGQARWYKVPVIPDETVSVELTGLTENDDLTIYKDIGQAFTSLASTQDLTQLSADFSGDAYSPSIYSPSIYSPSIYSPSIYSPSIYSPSIYSPSIYSPSIYSPSIYSPSIYSPSIYSPSIYSPSNYDPAINSPSTTFVQAFSSAQSQSLLAISAQDGTADENVTVNTWDNTGYFYIRVLGRNGAFDPANEFTLDVSTSGGICGGATNTFPQDSTIVGKPGSAQTVIVTDTARLGLSGAAKTTYQSTLAQLAARTDGVVVDVSASQRVVALHQQADANVDCPYAQNLVANEIRSIINSFRDTSGTLKYVVLAGDDDVIPFFRYADTSGLGPEDGYVPPVTDASAAQAALRDDVVLGQDAYGSTVNISVNGSQLPLPELPVGRLVETPAEIEGSVDAYLDLPNGTIPTNSSLVTGYDFLTGSADSVEGDLAAGMSASAEHDQLITNQGVPTTVTTGPGGPSRTASWTASDLSTALLGSHHDVVYLAGHFSANSALAADYTTSLVTDQVAAHPDILKDSLVFSAGCHSGYSLPDSDAVPGVTDSLDWAQLMAQQHATLVAGTGYQYADTDFLAYSAKLYSMMAHHLRDGSPGTPTSIAASLVAAKQQYLAGVTTLSGIDEKTLIEATVYGLPMTSVNLPNRNPAAVTTTPVTPQTVATSPGSNLGLGEADLAVSAPTTVNTRAAVDLNGNPTGLTYRWLSGPDGVLTEPALPALPLQSLNVTASDGSVLRGVGFRSGSYADTTGVLPLTGAAATEQDGVHSTFDSPAFFPQKLYNINYFGALTGSGGTNLNVTPAQYRGDTSGTDTERAYSSLGLQLFYSSNTSTYGQNTPALATPPSIGGVTGTTSGSNVSVAAHVTGDPSAGIQQVWVTYTAESGPLHGAWQSADLTQDGSDSTLWEGNIPLPAGQDSSTVRYLVQAVNGVGEVGFDDNLGDGYIPDVTVGNTPVGAASTTLSLDPTPGSATFGGTVQVGATLAGAPAGSPVSFDIGGGPVVADTDSSGHATVTLPVQSTVGTTTFTANYAGDTTHAPSHASTSLTIAKAAAVLDLSTASTNVESGSDLGVSATLTTSAGAPLPQRSIEWVVSANGTTLAQVPTITDRAGVAHLGALSLPAGAVTVTASFGGTATGQTPDPTYAAATANTALNVAIPVQISTPGTLSVPASSATGAAVTYSVTASGPDGPEAASCLPASGSTFAIGNTTVHCSASDGNLTGSGSFVVHVQAPAETLTLAGNQAQDITGVAASTLTQLNTAAGDLFRAAGAGNYSDGIRLNPAQEAAFFADLQAAEKQLVAAAKTKQLNTTIKAQILALEKTVAQVAGTEASLRIADAVAAGDTAKQLKNANAQLTKGAKDAAKGNETGAVTAYASAWSHAQKGK